MTQRPGRRAACTLLATATGTLLLAGCAWPAAGPTMTTAMVDQLPADLPQGRPHARVLLVYPPETRPVYDTTQMAYTLKQHEIAFFTQNQWGETPSQMLHALLLQAMQGTHAFDTVVPPPYTGPAALALRTEIAQFVQDFSAEPAVLRLELRVRLIDEGTGRVLASRDIAHSEPMGARAPQAGVLAANAAVAQALREVAGFVLEQEP